MSNQTIIQDLIDEGALVLYHDYRSGTLRDWSGNSNHGTATNAPWNSRSISPDTNGYISVPDSAELQGDEFTLVLVADIRRQQVGLNQRLFGKRDVGGTQYHLYLNGNNLQLYDGTNNRAFAGFSATDTHILSINCKDGESADAYVDGLFFATAAGASAISANDAPVYIGGWHSGSQAVNGGLGAVMQINRKLTATEHAQLYKALHDRRWPRKEKGKQQGLYVADSLTDGDMEAVGTAAYTAGNSATLTKQDNHAMKGTQVLRVAHNGTADPYAYQAALTSGTSYRVTGWARGDGTGVPKVNMDTEQWAGSNSTAWQRVDFVATADSTQLQLECTIAAAGFCEFDDISVREVTIPDMKFQTEWAAKEIANVAPGSPLPGTDIQVKSGAYAVGYEEVGGELSKVAECTNDGITDISSNFFMGDETESDNGTFEFWLYKANASATVISVIAQNMGAITAGDYTLEADASEVVILNESGVGAIVSGGSMSHSTWTKMKVTRSHLGAISLYIDDVLVGSGTNANLTESAGMVFDLDNGDKICLGSPEGKNALTFRRGVV